MVDPNFPESPQNAEGIDDFLTPEDPHLKELLEKEHMEMQTADTPGAALAAVTASDQVQPSGQDEKPKEGEPSQHSERHREKSREKDLSSSYEELQPTPLSKVPVDLQIEVTRLHLSLQQALDLKPGAIVPIQKNLDGEVDLVIGNKKIGAAELVRIGESLGMRITYLS